MVLLEMKQRESCSGGSWRITEGKKEKLV